MEPDSSRRRVLIVALLAMAWMGAALARLGYLQLVSYSDYLSRAQRQQQRIIEVSPKRGGIYDRNLRELALSISVDSCFAVPAEIANPDMAAQLLSSVLETSAEEIKTRLLSSRSFVWIARKLSPEKAERIQALNLRGVYFQKENQRFYPKRHLAAHVLGHVDIDEKGLGGIEYALDDQVRGKPGRMLILADARRRWYERNESAADVGASVLLTLDEKIQYIAEKELAAAVRETHALAGTIVVQEPNSGELLAVANWPVFNPNAPAEGPAEARMNRAVAALYEPGSIFKIITVAAALEEGITNAEERIDCQMGAIYITGHRIRDHKPFGVLSVAQVLAQSSDVGAIKLGLRLGAPKLYDYIRAFGFGSSAGVDLPGENHGLVRRLENWKPMSVGAISMGQEVGVTSVQMVTAVSAIANGGLLYRPHIVRELRRGSRAARPESFPPRRVVRPTTAAALRHMLEGVVLEGTGKLARLEGYTAAGKTGTAQKIDPSTGRYSATQYIASFVGFAPVNTPAVTVLVTLDSPQGRHHGGDVAAPVFKRVVEQVLAHLEVPQDMLISPQSPLQRASNRRSSAESLPDVSDFNPVQTETSPADEAAGLATPDLIRPVAASAPAPTAAVAGGETLLMPRLEGKTVRDVAEACARLSVNPILVGTGVAVEQTPEAGHPVQRGSSVTVRFERAARAFKASGGKN